MSSCQEGPGSRPKVLAITAAKDLRYEGMAARWGGQFLLQGVKMLQNPVALVALKHYAMVGDIPDPSPSKPLLQIVITPQFANEHQGVIYYAKL